MLGRCTIHFVFAIYLTAGAVSAYDLSWRTIDCGGGYSAAGDFEVEGAIGQPDAGVMAGGGFELVGGFWAGAASAAPGSCPEDIDGDGTVGLTDLSILLGNFGTAGGPGDGDITGDGQIDLADLSALLAVFGTSCP